MSTGSQPLSDKRKTKELKVLKLYQEGYSSRKIASLVHMSLRDVTKYIHRISNKTKSPSTTSVMDEVLLEYRVAGLKCEVRDLKIERDNLRNEVNDLRAQKYILQIQVDAKWNHMR
ncbi:MAG: helix-turn-helix transcriptional regulator [Nitrososphaeraceae archaeon]